MKGIDQLARRDQKWVPPTGYCRDSYDRCRLDQACWLQPSDWPDWHDSALSERLRGTGRTGIRSQELEKGVIGDFY